MFRNLRWSHDTCHAIFTYLATCCTLALTPTWNQKLSSEVHHILYLAKCDWHLVSISVQSRQRCPQNTYDLVITSGLSQFYLSSCSVKKWIKLKLKIVIQTFSLLFKRFQLHVKSEWGNNWRINVSKPQDDPPVQKLLHTSAVWEWLEWRVDCRQMCLSLLRLRQASVPFLAHCLPLLQKCQTREPAIHDLF